MVVAAAWYIAIQDRGVKLHWYRVTMTSPMYNRKVEHDLVARSPLDTWDKVKQLYEYPESWNFTVAPLTEHILRFVTSTGAEGYYSVPALSRQEAIDRTELPAGCHWGYEVIQDVFDESDPPDTVSASDDSDRIHWLNRIYCVYNVGSQRAFRYQDKTLALGLAETLNQALNGFSTWKVRLEVDCGTT